ncbi:aminotransferase class I/II-fold pyridoxal phosphate-dependent enzyme [Candidatus Peregrinibacteria bacterium]|nr:aminotransferase class I/II-fold pyridoxal phosphate-dependent enzyme [Candidatus Peregrinibacteria bacterium]
MLSRRIQRMTPSPTLSLNAQADEMRDQGIDVVNMAVGQPDFPVPKHIKKAAQKAARDGNGKYTPAIGTMPLRKAIKQKFARENNLSYQEDEIVVATGAKPILFAALLTLTNPGDDVLVPAPYWVTYPDDIRLCGAHPVFIPAREDDGFEIKADTIKQYITEKTAVLILNDPSNPTGVVISEEEKRKIAALCIKHNIWIIADEIYERLTYDTQHYSIARINDEVWEKTITLNGVSKTYAMPGWRIGYAGMPQSIAKHIGGALSHITGNPNTLAQIASIEALNGPQDDVEKMRHIYQKRRDYFIQGLNKIPGIRCVKPGGAFYLYPNMSALYNDATTNSQDMATLLLEKAHIAAVPGNAFGSDEHIRFSFATSEERINMCLARLENIFR